MSNGEALRGGPLGGGGGGATCIDGAAGSSGVAEGGGVPWPEADRWPRRLPKIERPTPCFPLATGAGPCPRVDANGVCLVSLLAFFSRSCSFLMNVLASFSSTNEKAAGQSSSSKLWKKVRSWLYAKLS